MSTLAVALAEIAALKARVDALEGSRGSGPSSGGGAPDGEGEALPDHMLDNAWANKKIGKDPKQWKGPTQVNRTYSRAPVEWLEMAARNMDFKASMGRKEIPVRLNAKGKPWHESDTFEAKILRGWARRNASKPAASPTARAAPPPMADDEFGFGANAATGSDDEIPF